MRASPCAKSGKWQMQHGLTPDGKIGPKTIAAAKKETKSKEGGGEEKSDVEFSESETGAIGPGVSADEAIEGGVADGEESAPRRRRISP